MKQTGRKLITWVILAVSLALFFGDMMKLNQKGAIGDQLREEMTDVAVSITDDYDLYEDLEEDDLSLEDIVDEILDGLNDHDAEEQIEDEIEYLDLDLDADDVLDEFRYLFGTFRNGGFSYVELGKGLSIISKEAEFMNLEDELEVFAAGVSLVCFAILGIAVVLTILAVILSANGYGVGLVLYLVYNILTTIVSFGLVVLMNLAVDDSGLMRIAPARLLTTLFAIIAVVFWFSTKERAEEADVVTV